MYTKKIKKQLDTLYQYQTDGYIWPEQEEKGEIKSEEKGVVTTYGEITRQGVDSIIDGLGDFIDENTVFYDLGSGYGSLALHLCIRKNIKKAVGIEYFAKRRDYANNQVEKWEYRAQSNPKFVPGNYFNFDFSDATFVYWDNIMYYKDVESKRKVLKLLPKKCIAVFRSCTGLDEHKWRKIEATTTYQQKSPVWWAII